MNNPQSPQSEQKRMGGGMIAAMWILFLVLLGFLFNNVLEHQHNPNQQVMTSVDPDGSPEVTLQRNRQGHYVTSGEINSQPVVFMLDTGATDVSVPAHIAAELGLRRGAAMTYQTANGPIQVFSTRLHEVAIGGIHLYDIRATINPQFQGDEILLGMSFLGKLEFTQKGDTLILRQNPEM